MEFFLIEGCGTGRSRTFKSSYENATGVFNPSGRLKLCKHLVCYPQFYLFWLGVCGNAMAGVFY